MTECETDISYFSHKLKMCGLSHLKAESNNTNLLVNKLLKSFLQEKGVSACTKINIASFLELEARNLLFTVSDIELTYSTFKKAFLTTVGERAAIIKGQCLVSMTTILLQLFGKKEVENEVIGLFSEHLLFLLALVQQSNNPSNVYVRFMAANCLTEVELNFPRILRECINNLYSLSLIETSVAHQQYMCLLALTVKNSVASESLETLWGKFPKVLFKDKLHQVDETELTIADINQMVSFLLDQLVLCTKEGSFWIICLVMEMMRSRADLQLSVQVLKPILIHNLRVYNPQSFHVVHLLLNHFGSMLFEEKDRTELLNQTLVNATHPSLPACLKLLYLDWAGSYFQGDTSQTPHITKLIPGVFDGPETQLKKLHILSGFLKNKSGASMLLLQASANLQSQVRPGSSIKYKAAFTRVLYRYLCDHPTTDIINKVPNLVLATGLQDMSYIPFALDLVRCLHNTPELSAVSATIFEPLVSVFSQPDSPTTLATLPHVLLIFQHEILYREICQPQRTLLYLAEHVLTKEVCEILSWSLGHQILSLCHTYMKEFDVTECFNELCQVLNAFISGSDDVDILDRANMYRTLLLELSESKLKELLRTPKHGPKDKVEFQSSRTVKKVDVPFLRLSKQRQTMAEAVEHEHLCPQHVAKQDILKMYTQEIPSLSKKRLIINCTIDFIDKCEEGLQFIEALAIFLEVPESWGKIDPIMVGHVDRRQDKRTALDIVCFPECPYPVIAAARAEFSINNVMHLCSLEPFKLDLEDFFQPLPLLDGTPMSPSEVFACLWSHLEENCGTTSHISVHTQPCSRDEFLIRFGSLVTEELQGENSLHVAIFLPPGKHLLMKVAFKDDCAVVRLATDDIFLLAHINSYFKTWS